MDWNWRKDHLDLVLVPSGLLIMFGYHIFLLYRYRRIPHKTTIGYENHFNVAWIERIMQLEAKDRGQALTVISSNITAATSLSSISLVLSSLIGTWIGSSTENIFTSNLVYGNTSPSVVSIKYITLLSSFLVAFACFVQTARQFVHANFLISMPNCKIPLSYIEKPVTAASAFWSIGIRALYFAIILLLWIFGPIPMFVSSVIMVVMLHILDSNSTELHEFQPIPSDNSFDKIGKEMTAVTRGYWTP